MMCNNPKLDLIQFLIIIGSNTVSYNYQKYCFSVGNEAEFLAHILINIWKTPLIHERIVPSKTKHYLFVKQVDFLEQGFMMSITINLFNISSGTLNCLK